MDDIRLESYSKALIEAFNSDLDTMAVLERLGASKRGEYEAAIVPKADLIAMVKHEDYKRREDKQKANALAEIQGWKAEVERERAEDALLPPRHPTALELKLQGILNAKDEEAQRRTGTRTVMEVSDERR